MVTFTTDHKASWNSVFSLPWNIWWSILYKHAVFLLFVIQLNHISFSDWDYVLCFVFHLIIPMKSEVWTTSHCLALGHKLRVHAVSFTPLYSASFQRTKHKKIISSLKWNIKVKARICCHDSLCDSFTCQWILDSRLWHHIMQTVLAS